MADFTQAYQLLLAHEGNYSNDPNDPGGETYKGIARKMNSKWDGWTSIDILRRQPGFPANLDKDLGLQSEVENFYRIMFWDPLKGDQIENQKIANSIFDFGVNAGLTTSVSLAQMVVDAKPDGVIGPMSLAAINKFDPELFIASFTIAKIARYISTVKKRPEIRKYFYGWVCRAMGM